MFLGAGQWAEHHTRAQKQAYGVRPKGHLAYRLPSDAGKQHMPEEAC